MKAEKEKNRNQHVEGLVESIFGEDGLRNKR